MAETTQNNITKTGGCHCGSVRYEVAIDLAEPVTTCNCSMCGKSGTMLSFVPDEAFKLLQGDEVLGEYRFNHQVIAHLFCKQCGIKSFARGVSPDGSKTVTVNVRRLDDVDLDMLNVQFFEGKNY